MSLLKIKVLDKSMIEKYKNYIESRDSMDAGFDLFIPDGHVIRSSVLSHVIDHKVQIEYLNDDIEKIIPVNIIGLKKHPSHILMSPRSSISKTSLRLANSIGILDSGYRGNVIAKVDNLGKETQIEKGTSLFQLLVGENCQVKIVDELSETRRGQDGFGSTGNTQV